MAPRFTLMLASAAAAALTVTGSTIAGGSAEAAPAKQQRHVARPPARRNWAQLLQTYIEGEFRANPAFAVNQGRHEYDGRLPDWSATGLHNERMRLRSAICTSSWAGQGRFSPIAAGFRCSAWRTA